MTLDPTVILLSRIQSAFTVSFPIIFPAFTIGLAAWLAVLEALHLATRRQVYHTLFGACPLVYSITVDQAAAPPSSLTCMFWGAGVIVLPLTLAFMAAVYLIFRRLFVDADGYGGKEQAPTHRSVRLPVDAPTTAAARAFDDIVSVAVVLRLIRDVIRLPRGSRNHPRRSN